MMTTEDRDNTIRGLRELADFLESHPLVPAPYKPSLNVFTNTETEIPAIARCASWEKVYLDCWFTLARKFSGDVTLEVNVPRKQVCRKVRTGERVVPAQPERIVEEFEWVCDEASLLGKEVR